jgi:hypothetical protein
MRRETKKTRRTEREKEKYCSDVLFARVIGFEVFFKVNEKKKEKNEIASSSSATRSSGDLSAESSLLLLLVAATAAAALLEATAIAAILAIHATLDHLVQHALGLVDGVLRAAQRACALRRAIAIGSNTDLASRLELQTLDLLSSAADH